MKDKDYNLGKIPPQAIQLEEAILASLLINSSLIDELKIVPEYCYAERNKIIFEAVKQLHDKKLPVDILTVTEQLKKNKKLDEVGGVTYLTDLTSKIAGTGHAEYHSAIIEQKYILRELIQICSTIENKCYDDQDDIDDIISEYRKSFERIDNIVNHHLVEETIECQTNELLNKIDDRKERFQNNLPEGIPTGFKGLDRLIRGFKGGELTILGARPSMGKTAISLKLLRNVIKKDYRACFISIEMTKIAILDRIILGETELNSDRYYSGDINNIEQDMIERCIDHLNEKELYIYDDVNSFDKIRAIVKKTKCEIVFIDYLGLMKLDSSNKNLNRNHQIGDITKQLKSLSKEFNIPVIVLVQLSRETEKRANKRPILSDLRDSGEIEQDADIVMFVHRPKYYDDTMPEGGELIIAKDRNGALGIWEFDHNESLTVITEKNFINDISPNINF